MQSGGLRTRGITKSSRSGEPLISIVTVVYNGAATLEQTIRSVLGQTYGNVEYIIIDGGSTDGTLDIIREYGDRIDFWQSEPDKGIYDAMNKSLGMAKGDFLLFLGADDVLFHPMTIEKCAGCMVLPDVNYYGNVYFEKIHRIYDYGFHRLKICIANICQQSIFYCRESYIRKRFDAKYPICADWKMNIELWAEKAFIYIPEIVSIFADRGSSTQKGDPLFFHDRISIIRRNFGFPVVILFILFRNLYPLFHFFGYMLAMRKSR